MEASYSQNQLEGLISFFSFTIPLTYVSSHGLQKELKLGVHVFGIHRLTYIISLEIRDRNPDMYEKAVYMINHNYNTMCFEYEIPNSLKAKNKDKALEDAELEPELEKVEEQPIVSKS